MSIIVRSLYCCFVCVVRTLFCCTLNMYQQRKVNENFMHLKLKLEIAFEHIRIVIKNYRRNVWKVESKFLHRARAHTAMIIITSHHIPHQTKPYEHFIIKWSICVGIHLRHIVGLFALRIDPALRIQMTKATRREEKKNFRIILKARA